MNTSEDIGYDFPSAEVAQRPFEFYAALREHGVYKLPERNDYLVARYDQTVWAYLHPEVLSNIRDGKRLQDTDPEVGAIYEGQRYPHLGVIVDNDPPDHAAYRELGFRAFTPGRLRSYEASVRALADRLIDGFAERGSVEYVSEFANPLPMTVIIDILGLDHEMRQQYKQWSDDWGELQNQLIPHDRALEVMASGVAFNNHLAGVIEERRADPHGDVISDMTQARKPSGELFDIAELMNVIRVLLIAGNETTAYFLGNSMILLLKHPEVMRAIRRDRSLIPRMFEEVIRLETSSQFSQRYARVEFELGGVTIPAGARLLLMRSAANRDPTHFADPDQIDLMRPNIKDHVGFGKGIHSCLGAPLARLEGRTAWNAVLDRFAAIRFAVDPAEIRYNPRPEFRGPIALPLEFELA